LEADRELSLLRQAYVEGYLDPREAALDLKWKQKVKWTLEWLERRNLNEIRKLQHDINCSLMDYFTGDRAIDLHWDQAHQIQNRIRKALMPWVEIEEAAISRKSFYEMVDTWKRIFGDPKDPEVAAKINKTAAALMEMAAKTW
jgi:hypothetical protein